jgi:hypothetical protein
MDARNRQSGDAACSAPATQPSGGAPQRNGPH